MKPQSLAQLAELVGGEVEPDHAAVVAGPDVVIDSRVATAGSLFVALVGERADGHAFVAETVGSPAAAALVRADRWAGPAEVPVIRVADTEQALGRLGRRIVDQAVGRGLVVFGITGSMGKTSTKDLLAQILRSHAETVAPQNSFNTEIGVPLTATRISDATGYLVSEMGARGIGHIATLCRLTPPRVGVVLNVAHAHIGEFGSQAAIAQAKGELVEALPADGWAVLNADDPLVAAMADRTTARIARFAVGHRPDTDPEPASQGGSGAALAVWADQVRHDQWDRHRFTLQVQGFHPDQGRLDGPAGDVRLATPGAAQLANATAAAAAAIAGGLAPDAVARALDGAAVTSRWRMELTETDDGTMVVNDAYNANPDAVLGALATTARMARDNQRRLGVVLGDMLELGSQTSAGHAVTGRAVAGTGAAWAVFVGDYAVTQADAAVAAGMPSASVRVVPDTAAATAALSELRHPGDVVLIKGSRGMALETVAEQLVEESAR